MRSLLVILLLLAGNARAYPQFQLSTGAMRCNQCHFAPAGGGLINSYGRSEAEDTISNGGDGDFLHGAVTLPKWLALGGDVRLAGLVNEVGSTSGAEWAAFPMQADLYANVHSNSFFFQVAAGFRGRIREGQVDQSALTWFESREHWIMYRPKPAGWYVRAGRFYAPFGLRLPEHDTYVRSRLGFNVLEETYGLEGGYVVNDWELHVTGFTHDPIQSVGVHDSGAAVLFEQRPKENLDWGLTAKASFGSDDTRLVGGAIGKAFVGQFLLMAEADLLWSKLAGHGQAGFVGYLGASRQIVHSLWLRAAVERYDEDFAVEGVARDAGSLMLQWFPRAHFELMLYGKAEVQSNPAYLGLLQFHYYL